MFVIQVVCFAAVVMSDELFENQNPKPDQEARTTKAESTVPVRHSKLELESSVSGPLWRSRSNLNMHPARTNCE